jgi:hypothetical protein
LTSMIIIPNIISQCGITSSTNPAPLNINSSFALQYVFQREVHMLLGNFMTQDIKFENCDIYLDSDYIYNNSTDPIPRMEFINCKIYVDRGFRGSTSNTANGFISMPVQLVFDGCCFEGDNPAEVLHIEGGGLIFTNNTVNITNSLHMFHFKNIDTQLENAFYGNTINFQIEPGFQEGLMSLEQNSGTIKIGDNYQNKNIFNIIGTAIIDRSLNDNLIVENSEFNIDAVYNNLIPESHAIYLSRSKGLDVNNCIFNGKDKSEIGIYLKSCENFSISNSQLNTLEEAILVSEKTKQFNVSSCSFSSNKTAIKSSFANQSFAAGDILGNTFTSNTIDIHSTGAWLRLDVISNNFSGQQYGILADGDNKYNIDRNSFFNSYAGSILYSNGDNENLHVQNQFNTIIGVHSLNQNEQYEFLDNCFSSTAGDVYIDGTVMSQVGQQSREAGNCFTKQGIPDISANGTTFEYYRPDSKVNTCSDPITTGSYSEPNAVISPDLVCGSGVIYTGTVYNYCNFNIKTLTCDQAKQLANQLLTQINFVNGSNTYTNLIQKAYVLKRLRTCRARLLKFMFGCKEEAPHDPNGGGGSFSPGDGTAAGVELKNSSNKYESAAFVGLAIELGHLQDASDYLASMPYSDEEMLDYKGVQLINIQFQTLRDSFVLSQTQKSLLYSIGLKPHPLAGYARGLYHQLTGQTIYPSIPVKTFTRTKINQSSVNVIYPNPVSNVLTIESASETNHVRITDISGRIILSQQIIDKTSQFDTSTWSSGLYIVTLTDQEGKNESYKLVKQ